jgi:HEAT repeat protein
LVVAEPDPVVLQAALDAVAGDAGQAAEQLALAAMSHPAVDVRRRACQWLEKHADPRYEAVLTTALSDPQTAVSMAAIRAISAAGRMGDPRPLVQLLAHRDTTVRLEAATALARLRVQEGRDALLRLSQEADAGIRRQAALAIGATGDMTLVPTLVQLLDDPRTPVQQAALSALAQLTGQNFSRQTDGKPASHQEQARRWKEWRGLKS